MHLLIDGQALQTSSSRLRGIGRYSSNLLRALAVARPGWRIEVVQNSALEPIAAEDLNGLPVLPFTPPLPPRGRQCELNERYYADWLAARGADALLILSHCEGWDALVPEFQGPRPLVFGIAYDLIPLLFPEHYLHKLSIASWFAYRFRNLLRSDVLLAISEATARDVQLLGGSEAPVVVNIGGAVDPLFAPLSAQELAARAGHIREQYSLSREFVLYVGATDYRKNLEGAIRGFAALPAVERARLDLAVVCRMNAKQKAAFEETAREVGIASQLRLICSAGDEELRALYQMCRVFFFPSLYEGLGLPVLEALHCGAPVVTSDCSSLPEYAGDVSWMGDPSSAEKMARVLQHCLAEPRDARRGEREAFARTFSWQKTAERTCAVLEQTCNNPRTPSPRPRRVAWVLPLTPGTRQLTEYVAQVLPFLDDHLEIELIAASEPLDIPEALTSRHLVLTARELQARHAAHPYDLFVYHLSARAQPREMLDLLGQFPGLLVFQDETPAHLPLLFERKLLTRQTADARNNRRDAEEATPVLGVLVHSVAAKEQLSCALTVPVVHLPRPGSLPGGPAAYAAALADWIKQAIARYEQQDGLWRSFALTSLADRPDVARKVVDSWALLRLQALQRASRHAPSAANCVAPSAA